LASGIITGRYFFRSSKRYAAVPVKQDESSEEQKEYGAEQGLSIADQEKPAPRGNKLLTVLGATVGLAIAAIAVLGIIILNILDESYAIAFCIFAYIAYTAVLAVYARKWNCDVAAVVAALVTAAALIGEFFFWLHSFS